MVIGNVSTTRDELYNWVMDLVKANHHPKLKMPLIPAIKATRDRWPNTDLHHAKLLVEGCMALHERHWGAEVTTGLIPAGDSE